jgi:anti-anti-sigma factor
MSVTIERSGESPACIAHISGDIDLATVPEVREQVDHAIASGCSYVVLNLADVPYADSSALGLLVWIDRQLSPRHGKLVIAGADRNVARVLELSGLLGVAPSISTAPDVEEALDGLPLQTPPVEPLWERVLTTSAHPSEISRIRGEVCEMIAPLGLSDSSLFDVKVAVGEALANAVRHGSPGGASDEVTATVSAYPDRVVVAVRDGGCGYDGNEDTENDVYASGGRGVAFMRALADRVEFARCEGGGTVVRITKRVGPGHVPGVTDPGGTGN